MKYLQNFNTIQEMLDYEKLCRPCVVSYPTGNPAPNDRAAIFNPVDDPSEIGNPTRVIESGGTYVFDNGTSTDKPLSALSDATLKQIAVDSFIELYKIYSYTEEEEEEEEEEIEIENEESQESSNIVDLTNLNPRAQFRRFNQYGHFFEFNHFPLIIVHDESGTKIGHAITAPTLYWIGILKTFNPEILDIWDNQCLQQQGYWYEVVSIFSTDFGYAYEVPGAEINGVSIRDCDKATVRDYMIDVFKNQIITITPAHKYGDGVNTYSGNLLDMLVLCISKLELKGAEGDDAWSGFNLLTPNTSEDNPNVPLPNGVRNDTLYIEDNQNTYLLNGINNVNNQPDVSDLQNRAVDYIMEYLDNGICTPEEFYVVATGRNTYSVLYNPIIDETEQSNSEMIPYVTTDTAIMSKAGIAGRNLYVFPIQGFGGISIVDVAETE